MGMLPAFVAIGFLALIVGGLETALSRRTKREGNKRHTNQGNQAKD